MMIALLKPSLIDLETQAWVTGRKQAKAVQRERLSERASLGMMRQSGLSYNAKKEMREGNKPRLEIGHKSNRSATWVWDELTPDVYSGTTAQTYDTAFFLNTKFYKLYIDSQTDFVTTPFVSPENQTAKTALILFMGNSGVTNMRKHGLAAEISLSITS